MLSRLEHNLLAVGASLQSRAQSIGNLWVDGLNALPGSQPPFSTARRQAINDLRHHPEDPQTYGHLERDFLLASVDRLRFDGMPVPEPIAIRAHIGNRRTLMGPAAPETPKGAEASERNPRASDPFNVRAILDSNQWPLAPEANALSI